MFENYKRYRDGKKAMVTYKFKRKPYHHQVDALKKLINTGFGGALLMEPRTGKTKVCVDYASILHEAGRVNRVLVVCPNSVMGVWEDEIDLNCPYRRRVVTWDRRGRKTWDLPSFGMDVLDFVIINYEAFQTPGDIRGRDEDGNIIRSRSRGGRFTLKKQLIAWQPQLIILDESHRIKSPSARKTTTLWSIGPVADYRVVATGTAVTKKKRVFDIYAQWKFLKPDGWIADHTLASFKGQFGIWRSMGKYDRFIATQNMPKLHKLIHADSYAVTRDECYDLPPSRSQIYHIELSIEEQRVYDEMTDYLIARIESGEITEASIKLVQILRLAQITSGIAKTTEDKLVRIGRSKIDHLYDRLSDLFEADEKVVVAARFIPDIQAIMAIGKKLKVPVYPLYGKIKRRQRDLNIQAFRKHEGAALFVMQPQAGALGIDLSTAATMIWYSLTNSYVDYDQASQRIALSPRGTVIEYMLARGTIDELMYESLQEDKDLAKMIHASPDRLRRNYKSSGTK
jgi:SNF2 family DNA or RNA helicase